MHTVDLSLLPKDMNQSFRGLIWDDHRVNIIIGGAGSGKSYATAQKVIYKCLAEEGHVFLLLRKVARTLRFSIIALFNDLLIKYGLKNTAFTFNKTEMSYQCINGNKIISIGLDDVEKLKSIHGVTDIIIEEASELVESDFEQLDLRLRGETEFKKQIILLLNPISSTHWIKRKFFDNVHKDCFIHHSTYRDNTELDQDYIHTLENIPDGYYKDVYVLGKWGTYGDLVFNNFIIEDFRYTEDDFENVCTGMDFGFIHAQTIMRLGFKDGEIYIFDEFYAKKMQNSDFIKEALEYFGDMLYNWPIIADSAEPDKIDEWNKNGFYKVEPAKKGAGSKRFGIEFLAGHRIHIHKSKCPNAAREFAEFQRKKNKDGIVDNENYIEINDDTIAACRYATEYLWSQYKGQIGTWELSSLGL